MKGGTDLFPVTGDVWSQAVIAQKDLDGASHYVALLVQKTSFNEPNNSMVPEAYQSEMKKASQLIFEALTKIRNFMDNATSDGVNTIPYEPLPIPYPPDVQP